MKNDAKEYGNGTISMKMVNTKQHIDVLPDEIPINDLLFTPSITRTELNIISDNEAFDALEHEWNEIAWNSDTNIFQTFEWNRTWWKHFGKEGALHILTIHADDKLAGIIPFFKDNVSLFGFKPYSCLRLLGSTISQPQKEPLLGLNSYSDYLDFIIRPGYEDLCNSLLIRYLQENLTMYDEIILDEIPDKSSIWKSFIPAVGKSELNYSIEQASASPVITLESTWEKYLATLKPKQRQKARRYVKQTKEEKVIQIRKIEHSSELTEVLAAFIQMHQKQWNERGFAGTFAETRMACFFKEIIKLFYDKEWAQIKMAVARPNKSATGKVAMDAILAYKDKRYLWLRSMDNNPQYRKLGPGNVLLYTNLEEAINNKANSFDFLRGREQFKLQLADNVIQNKKITLFNSSRPKRLLPGLTKGFILRLKHGRLELKQVRCITAGKSIKNGIRDYVHFIAGRFRQKIKA